VRLTLLEADRAVGQAWQTAPRQALAVFVSSAVRLYVAMADQRFMAAAAQGAATVCTALIYFVDLSFHIYSSLIDLHLSGTDLKRDKLPWFSVFASARFWITAEPPFTAATADSD
jgi:hypothetical protein